VPIPLRVLFIEDSEDDAALQVRCWLKRDMTSFMSGVIRRGLPQALERPWTSSFLNYSMPHFRGTDALTITRQKGMDVPFIFVSGTIGEDSASGGLKNRRARLLDEIESRPVGSGRGTRIEGV